MLSSLLSCFLIVMGSSFCNAELDDKVTWESSERLSYSDFRAAAPILIPNVAATNFEISFAYTISDNQFQFNVQCNFVRNLSWMKPEGKNQHVLNHEQKHFDLAEAHARLLRKRLYEADINIHNHKEKTDAIYDSVWDACLKAQRAYDESTHHSFKHTDQVNWDDKIEDMLVEYSDYAS